MKRIYTVLALLGLAMGLMLTGCGESGGGGGGTATNAPASGTATNK